MIKALAASVLAMSVLFGAQAMRAVPRISIDELKALMSQRAVLLIDVRDAAAYRAGRIPGAVNVDYTQILKAAKTFAGETRTIVTYCACANDTTAARAAVDLAAAGIAGAKALRGGWDEWVQRGEQIENSEIDRWWAHVAFLANDAMRGRQTGSPEHRRAAEYVAEQFKKAGLKPGAGTGYLQSVQFVSRRVLEDKSRLALVRDGVEQPITFGEQAMFNMRVDHAPSIDAPLVFAGHGLVVPEAKHDDLAGLDLKGKVVVLLTGFPSNVPGPLGSHYQSVRWQALGAAGAIGTINIQNPIGQDSPWERQMPTRFLPQMALADPAFDEAAGQRLSVTFNPAHAEMLFAGTGHTFAEMMALAKAGKPLPRFALRGSIRAVAGVERSPITSENVVGILPGIDPKLKDEYLVVTAHLDHLGTDSSQGDNIYNGAMDNASGIATLIETAAAAANQGFKRSIAFVAVTAEEKGLLGSRYFASKPTVPARGIVANLNTDMFLPLFPLKSIVAQGLEESDLAGDLRAVAARLGIEALTDPEPERNAFTRSDQYSFIRSGVPALSLKVGFVKDSPEHEIVRKWRAERYHSPRDDLAQPVDKQAAVAFNRVYLRLLEAVANRPTRPAWNSDSFFKRFAAERNQRTR